MLSPLISAAELREKLDHSVVLDCRFSLADPSAGEACYLESHIAGAHYLHLERDLSGPVALHGGRHPLPEALEICERLGGLGIGRDTPVVTYDDSGFAFAARAWWMLRSLGFSTVQVLDGGYAAWCVAGGAIDAQVPQPQRVQCHVSGGWSNRLCIERLREARMSGAILLDSREEKRYLGLEEPIDPVAGHIPGAVNYPWQGVTDSRGLALDALAQRARWKDLDDDRPLVVYCGSGVTACVNLLSLELAGRTGARLYAGSWSDWCSYLETDADINTGDEG